MPLSNIFTDRLDDLVDSSNNKDVINRNHSEYATSPLPPAINRNGGADHCKIEEGVVRTNRVARYSVREEEAVRKNRVTGHSKKEEGNEERNRVLGYSRMK